MTAATHRAQAEEYFKNASPAELQLLQKNIIAGLPGAEEGWYASNNSVV